MAQFGKSLVFSAFVLVVVAATVSAHGHHPGHHHHAPAPAPEIIPQGGYSPSLAPAPAPVHVGGAAAPSIPGVLFGGLSLIFLYVIWN